MIRRKVSTGLLRASKSNSSLRSTALAQHVAATPVSQTQTAGLASATLLSSQRNWGKETVVTLKTELKKRGLSQAGTKSILVDRISSAEASALLPPVPSVPQSKVTKAPANFTRNLSTSASASASKNSNKKRQAHLEEVVKDGPLATEQVTSTGPAVASSRYEAPKVEPIEPELLSVAPGLPQTKTESTQTASFSIEIPQPKAAEEVPQIIPVEPDNFRAKQPEPETPSLTSTIGKVVTAASPLTLPGGGPSHAIHEAIDVDALEATVEEIKTDIPALGAAVSSALSAPARALRSAEISKVLPEVGAPKGRGDSKDYKPSGKALDEDEKKGLWVIGGLVGLGLFFGGGRKRKEKKDHSLMDAVVPGGVKGDAEWSKASGAGVVGHGSRKDNA